MTKKIDIIENILLVMMAGVMIFALYIMMMLENTIK